MFFQKIAKVRCLAVFGKEMLKVKHSNASQAIVCERYREFMRCNGAQSETRTRTSVRTRRPERRASTNSATWAKVRRRKRGILRLGVGSREKGGTREPGRTVVTKGSEVNQKITNFEPINVLFLKDIERFNYGVQCTHG